jgi:hypothetical protein
MVGYTMVSLTLIAQPLVTETASAAAQSQSSDPRVLAAGAAGPSAGVAREHGFDVAVDAAR